MTRHLSQFRVTCFCTILVLLFPCDLTIEKRFLSTQFGGNSFSSSGLSHQPYLSRERRRVVTNEEPEDFKMVENYAKCCQSAVIEPSWSRKETCYDSCPEAMATDSVRGTCKDQDGLFFCLDTLKSAYKSCTKPKYPGSKKCWDACQSFLDGLVSDTSEQLNKTVHKVTECLEQTGTELSGMLDELQYHKGTRYESCCAEISSRDYQSWRCSTAQCAQYMQTLDVRLAYANLRQQCLSDTSYSSNYVRSDAEEAVLHLKNCLKIKELDNFPRVGQVPRDVSLNLSITLPRINGFGYYCCQFVPSKEVGCFNQCQKIFEMPGSTTSSGAQVLTETFDLKCGQKTGMQTASTCVQNVIAGQCRPGCSRMNFCASFNNQPDVTFRRCTDEADQAASNLYEMWTQRNELSFDHLEASSGDFESADDSSSSGGMGAPRIPLKDISNCDPLVFKAVACALTIKPCSRTQNSRICLKDCVRLLTNCGNFSSSQDPAEEALRRCSLLLAPSAVMSGTSPADFDSDDNSNCVSIYHLSETKEQQIYSRPSLSSNEITYPCSSSNLCRDEDKQVCEISRPSVQTLPSKFSISTVPNKCTKGCSMQEWSTIHMMSLPGDLVIASLNGNASHCIVCRCVENINPDKTSFFCDIEPKHLMKSNCNFQIEKKCPSVIENGQQSRNPGINANSPVRYYQDSTAPSGDFIVECNLCSCLGMKRYCTKRLCLSDYLLESDQTKYGIEFTGMPDNSDDEFLATCASNGRTYPNDEVTEKLGLREYQLGACELRRRCYTSMCAPGFKCVTNREVCLSKQYECIQHRCVKNDDCLQHVCDEYGVTHASRCDQDLPMRSGSIVEISYAGRCDQRCEQKLVCGTNGHTYSSACAAFYDRVLVDYPGKCKDFAVQISDTEPRPCYKIGGGCSALPSFCQGVQAFGVCCPICGAVARLIAVPELVDMVHATLVGNNSVNPPDQYTVRDVVLAVRQHITLPQCDVFGHLALDDSVTLMFVVPFDNPSARQVTACIDESKRIISLFAKRDVTLISDIHLFPIAGADIQTSFVKLTDLSLTQCPQHTLLLTSITFYLFYSHLWLMR